MKTNNESKLKMKDLGAGKTCISHHNPYLSQHALEDEHPSHKRIIDSNIKTFRPKRRLRRQRRGKDMELVS